MRNLIFFRLVGGFALAGIPLAAQTGLVPDANQGAAAPADTKPAAPAAPVPELKAAIVPEKKLAAPVLAGADAPPEVGLPLPIFDAGKSAALDDANKQELNKTNAAVGEVHALPTFTTKDTRPPTPDQMLTPAERLNRHLGRKNGLDRGVLNKQVLHWDFGPATIQLFGAETNEQRAKTREADEKRQKSRAELLDLVSSLKDSGDDAEAKKLKQQSDRMFARDPAFGRK